MLIMDTTSFVLHLLFFFMFFLMTRKCETIRSNNSTSTCTRITNPTSKIEEQHISIKGITHRRHKTNT